MNEYLSRFIPESFKKQVHFVPEVIPAIKSLSRQLPTDRIWDAYSTARYPGQTGGRVVFPYYRIDTSLAVCEMALMRAEGAKTVERATKVYKEAAASALDTVAWIEVGFGGLEKLMQNRSAVRNTTAGDDEKHNKAVLLSLQQQYRRVLGGFVQTRIDRGITDDDFARFNLEHLLYQFRSPEVN